MQKKQKSPSHNENRKYLPEVSEYGGGVIIKRVQGSKRGKEIKTRRLILSNRKNEMKEKEVQKKKEREERKRISSNTQRDVP